MKRWISPNEAIEAIRRGTGRGVRVAVLDSGIEKDHPALAKVPWGDDIAVVERGYRLAVEEGERHDLYGHGTAVAGIIHATAPEAEIASIRVLGSSIQARTSVVVEGARQAIERGYRILNCSLGCTIIDHVLKYKDWVDEAYLRGVHVVAACNNEDSGRQEWPAYFSSVVAVNMARTERDGEIFYKPGNLVEFAAQGVDVEVPWADGTMKRVTGSSFAAPRVTGLLARLLSEIPELTPLEAKALLHRLAQPWSRDLLAE
jgi:subtilisin family serine protease